MMKTLHFQTVIEAPAERVWHALWDDKHYREWTMPFMPGSYMELDEWRIGGIVRFLSPAGEGMYSRIAELEPAQRVSFEHLGALKNGQPVEPGAASAAWSGARETYSLSESANETTLYASVDTTEESAKYFEDVFPQALNIVKWLAEGKR